MNPKWIRMFLDIALRIAQESHAQRKKVGAVFVSLEGIMSIGINGLPADGDNECEYKEWFSGGGWIDPDEVETGWPYEGTYKDRDGNEMQGRYRLITKDEVSHAEENLFAKLMKQGVSTKGGMLFMTDSPCIHCAKIIVGAGITHVYYIEKYRKTEGIDWLIHNGVQVIQVN